MSNPLNGILGPTAGGAGSGGDVVGPASSTDNAVARYDGATGKLLQNSDLTVSDLAAGAITISAGKGTAITLKNTNPDATTGASVAGDPLAITAGDAVASTDTAGAAAGGALTLTSGNAARRTSGNAAGGDLVITPGEPVGTGVPGRIWLNYATAASDQVYATPRLVLNRLANTGFGAYETSNLISFVGGNPYINLKANDTSVTLLSGIVLNFGAPSLTTNGDVGLARIAAGVVKVTDGGAGAGSILVKGGATSASVRFGGSTAAEPALGSHASTSTGNVHAFKADVSDWTGVNASEFFFSNTGRGFSPGGGTNTNTSIGDNGFRALNTAGTDYSPIAGSIISAKTINGAQGNVKIATTTVNASGATSTATNLVPAGCILLGVTTRVTTAITSGDGGTSVNIGNGTDADMYGATIAFALGTTTNLASHTASALAWKSAAESVVFTCVGGTFATGQWRVCAHYLDLTAPTS